MTDGPTADRHADEAARLLADLEVDAAVRQRRRRLARWSSRARLVGKIALRWTTLFAGVVTFAHLATELHQKGKLWFDRPILQWLHARRRPGLTRLVLLVTELGSLRFLVTTSVAAGAALWLRGNRRAAHFVWVVGTGSGLMNQALKAFFARQRPDSILHLSKVTGFAFPSGHSMGSAAVYGALGIVAFTRFPAIKWRVVGACTSLVAAIGVSRSYLFVHYPSDVLAGWALGVTWPLWLRHPLLTRPWRPLWRGTKRSRATQAALEQHPDRALEIETEAACHHLQRELEAHARGRNEAAEFHHRQALLHDLERRRFAAEVVKSEEAGSTTPDDPRALDPKRLPDGGAD